MCAGVDRNRRELTTSLPLWRLERHFDDDNQDRQCTVTYRSSHCSGTRAIRPAAAAAAAAAVVKSQQDMSIVVIILFAKYRTQYCKVLQIKRLNWQVTRKASAQQAGHLWWINVRLYLLITIGQVYTRRTTQVIAYRRHSECSGHRCNRFTIFNRFIHISTFQRRSMPVISKIWNDKISDQYILRSI